MPSLVMNTAHVTFMVVRYVVKRAVATVIVDIGFSVFTDDADGHVCTFP